MTEQKPSNVAPLGEAGGVAWCDLTNETGDRVSLTSRADNPIDALDSLIEAIEHAEGYGFYMRSALPTVETIPASPYEDIPPYTARKPSPVTGDKLAWVDKDIMQHAVLTTTYETVDQSPQPQLAPACRNLGLLQRKPTKAEIKPGDRYEIMVDSYKVSDGSVQFYKGNLTWPIIRHSIKSDYGMSSFMEVFGEWQPTDDGEKHMLKGDLVLTIQASEKLNSQGNPYENIIAKRRP